MQKEIITLKEHIEYQQDSVVSKEILKIENGTVTIFALTQYKG